MSNPGLAARDTDAEGSLKTPPSDGKTNKQMNYSGNEDSQPWLNISDGGFR